MGDQFFRPLDNEGDEDVPKVWVPPNFVEKRALVTLSWVGGEAIRERTPLCS